MTISVVQTASNSATAAGSVTVTLGSASSAGNTLVAVIYSTATTITSVKSGTSADNWTAMPSPYTNGTTGTVTVWYDPDATAGATTVVVATASGEITSMFVYEVSGLAVSSPLDKSEAAGGAPAAGTTWSSGASGTTGQASEFVVGVMGGYNDDGPAVTVTGPASPWSNETQVTAQTGVFLMTGYQITSSTGTYTYSGTASGTGLSGSMYYGAAVATFKASTSTTSTGSVGLGAAGTSGSVAVAVLGGYMGLANLAMSGTGLAVVNITTSGGVALATPGITAGIIPPSQEVFANIPSGMVTAGASDVPAAGTVETWTVTVASPFAECSAATTPETFFYAADPTANTEMMLVTACPGGSGAGQTWTVVRGADGTVPVQHNSNFAVVQVLSHASYAALQAVTGSASLSGGTATVACASVTSTSLIQLTSQQDGGTPGWLRVSARTPGVSFTITSSSGSDTSTVAYSISQG